MYGHQTERDRNARMMNGVMNLGGRHASSLEVDLALGHRPTPLPPSRLGPWLRALLAGRPRSRETHGRTYQQNGLDARLVPLR